VFGGSAGQTTKKVRFSDGFEKSCRIFHEEALVLRDTKQKATTTIERIIIIIVLKAKTKIKMAVSHGIT
jgi:hypothetical protein